jgi:hypothetical protein
MKKFATLLAAGMAMSVAGTAMAGFSTGVQAGPLGTNGSAGAATNGVYTFNYAGPSFFPGNFRFSGTLTDNAVGTWSSEARWRVVAPSGETFTMSSGLTGSSNTTPAPFVASNVTVNTGGALSTVANSVGTWTFRAFESADDGGTTVDGFWSNFSFDFDDFAAPTPPAGATNLGSLPAGGMLMGQNAYVSNTVQWYKITLGAAIPSGDLFRVHTYGNTLTGGQFGNEDTEIALFNSLGNVIASNDDLNGNLWSDIQITTGLAAGDYYVAAAAYNLSFGAGFTATAADAVLAGSALSGNIKLTVIPAPGSIALLGLGGLMMGRRRRA